jgi:hypothetical protein
MRHLKSLLRLLRLLLMNLKLLLLLMLLLLLLLLLSSLYCARSHQGSFSSLLRLIRYQGYFHLHLFVVFFVVVLISFVALALGLKADQLLALTGEGAFGDFVQLSRRDVLLDGGGLSGCGGGGSCVERGLRMGATDGGALRHQKNVYRSFNIEHILWSRPTALLLDGAKTLLELARCCSRSDGIEVLLRNV